MVENGVTMKTWFRAIWIAITRPQYVILCDDGMELLKESWRWSPNKTNVWYKATAELLGKYYGNID